MSQIYDRLLIFKTGISHQERSRMNGVKFHDQLSIFKTVSHIRLRSRMNRSNFGISS